MIYEPDYISIAFLFVLILYPLIFAFKIVNEENNIIEKIFRLISVVFYILTLAYMTGRGLYSDENYDILFEKFGILELGILSWAYIFMLIEIKRKNNKYNVRRTQLVTIDNMMSIITN